MKKTKARRRPTPGGGDDGERAPSTALPRRLRGSGTLRQNTDDHCPFSARLEGPREAASGARQPEIPFASAVLPH